MAAPTICRIDGEAGLVFPVTSAEYDWPVVVRILLYGFGLVYFFLGVAIVADVFMGSIERVTAKLVQRKDAEGKLRTKKLWNDTVATLTLMALGSSAPEIFLSVLDVVKKDFHFGDLGPSTIVGSAAFNLLVIIAVCVVVIPAGEVRVIANRPAFYVTAAFSFFAYVWMAFILTQSSPEVVDIWEAVVTALMLPVLVEVSYLVDKGYGDCFFSRLGLLNTTEDAAADAFAGAQVPTYLKFEESEMQVPLSQETLTLYVPVLRVGDCMDALTVNYHTEPLCAVPEFDFFPVEGSLSFAMGERCKHVQICIPPRGEWRQPCKFLLLLEELEGPAEFDPIDDGAEECTVLTVELSAGTGQHGFKSAIDRLIGLQMLRAGAAEWKEQWRNVLYCNGSTEAQQEASKLDWVFHILAVPWKILFSLIPPTGFFGGWLSFYSSLGGIALITAGVSDLAELFGCVIDIPAIVTSITFVALGTSMPDLFASLQAAKEDPTADASIVNVTGSNSVNVFLGLGVPWTVASCYWALVGDAKEAEWRTTYPEMSHLPRPAFVVRQQNLGFSVLAFGAVCAAALLMMHCRRKWLGGELGGPFSFKVMTFVVFLGFWFGWVIIVSWRVLNWADTAAFAREATMVQGACVFLMTAVTVACLCGMKIHHRRTVVAAARHVNDAECLKPVPAKDFEEQPKDISVDISIFDVRFAQDEPTEVRI